MAGPVARVLMIGAGAVGQVYGWHLQQGGAEVHVFVREKYAADAKAGFVVYPDGTREAKRFVPAGVLTSAEEVSQSRWDQVWLCVASHGLRGDWLPAITTRMGDATLVSLLPAMRDRALIAPLVTPERLVLGLIPFSAWQGPLKDEVPGPGTAWWFPPFNPSLFEGGAVVDPIVAILNRGGCPSKRGPATAMTARGSSFLLTVVAAMEVGGWTFRGLREPSQLDLAGAAVAQAMAVNTAQIGISPGPMGVLSRPWAIRLLSRLLPLVAPMDFEAFLRYHFSKVGEQTELAMEGWIAEGTAQGKPVQAIAALLAELRRVRGR